MELRECPLCGGRPVMRTYQYYTGMHTARVACSCGCSLQVPIHSSEDAVLVTVHALWNLRDYRPVKWREVAPS